MFKKKKVKKEMCMQSNTQCIKNEIFPDSSQVKIKIYTFNLTEKKTIKDKREKK